MISSQAIQRFLCLALLDTRGNRGGKLFLPYLCTKFYQFDRQVQIILQTHKHLPEPLRI